MKLSTIVFTLAFASEPSLFAVGCSFTMTESVVEYYSNITDSCGLDPDGLFQLPRWALGIYCKKPSCLEVMESIIDGAADCDMNTVNAVFGLYKSMAVYCKTSTGSSSVDKSDCSLSDKTKVIELRNDPVMTNVCGPFSSAPDRTKICGYYCNAYIKEKYIPALPNCTVDGADITTATTTICSAAGTLMTVSAVAAAGATLVTLALV
ncbi:hypothetical protein Poli38472_004413 [Pythium oligandrum]|uniref:Elicitin n=1 Tax=Pythium oligandrum TaxID=41045 RepID=A0A8K1CA89_PYTOL|nr:hypothetical protein Poli38472_004413 [Pythium oligandrum]|eukprot:TMW59344.1 hypothetical protein Poli38472_004413 [Pythium oligandrum]